MVTAKNPITGDTIATKETTDAYREGHDRIFGKKEADEPEVKRDEHGRVQWPFPTIKDKQ